MPVVVMTRRPIAYEREAARCTMNLPLFAKDALTPPLAERQQDDYKFASTNEHEVKDKLKSCLEQVVHILS